MSITLEDARLLAECTRSRMREIRTNARNGKNEYYSKQMETDATFRCYRLSDREARSNASVDNAHGANDMTLRKDFFFRCKLRTKWHKACSETPPGNHSKA